MARILKKIPNFASWEEEENFWETHSTADYAFENVPPEERLRLPPRWKFRRRIREIRLANPFAHSHA